MIETNVEESVWPKYQVEEYVHILLHFLSSKISNDLPKPYYGLTLASLI